MKASAFLTIFASLGAFLQAEVPSTLNYQGRVLQNGQPFEGTGHFVFGIYEGSTLLWTNKLPVPSPLNDPALSIDSSDAKALTVRNGVFTLRLGEGDANNAPVGTDVFFKFDGTQRVRTDLKLKVWFSPVAGGPYTKLEPDITFASVPFAQVAGVAEALRHGAVGTAQIADGAITGLKMAGGSIGTGQLADAAITQEKLAEGSVSNVKLGEGSVGTAQIATGVVITEKLADGAVTTEKLADGAVTTEKLGPGAVDGAKLANGSVDLQALTAELAKSLTPVGEIIAYGVPVTDTGAVIEPVPGYLLCNGAVIDGAAEGGKYSALVSALGNTWGNGGNASNPQLVNLPDLRGVFLRGVNGSATDGYSDPEPNTRGARKPGGNTGNNVGGFQMDQIKDHSHSYFDIFWSEFNGTVAVPESRGLSGATDFDNKGWQVSRTTGGWNGTETRGKNVYVAYLIKY